MASKALEGQAVDVVYYYTSCTGINPLDIQLNKTINALSQVSEAAHGLKHTYECEHADSTLLNSIETAIGISIQAAANIGANQKCAVINNIYNDIMVNVLCDFTINGLWQLWATHIAAGAMLYVCMFFTSHVKQKCKVTRVISLSFTESSELYYAACLMSCMCLFRSLS